MTGNKNGPANGKGMDWESQVNALLDGELEPADAEALKQAASEDHALAQTIISAYQLQRGLDQLGVEKAPASLRRSLRNIPREQKRLKSRPGRLTIPWPRMAAFAAVPLLVIGVVMLQPRQPSAAEVEQARQELSVAFSYLDRINSRASGRIVDVLGSELRSGVKDNISEHIPYTESSRKEERT
jgi:hypothetical protein